MVSIDDLKRIAWVEFGDIVKGIDELGYKLRIFLINNSFIDVYLSRNLPGKFGIHWECRDSGGFFYRYDNFPDQKFKSVSTYPYHFHNGTQDNVEASPFPLSIPESFRGFLQFAKEKVL